MSDTHITTIVRNGTVVTPLGVVQQDILITDGRIAALGADLVAPGATVIDVSGMVVLPGGVDVHTHLGMTYAGARTVDTFASGTAAAAFGGTTTVIDFAIQQRDETMLSAFERRLAECAPQAKVDFGLHVLVQDVHETFRDDLRRVKAAGVSSIQLTLSDPGGWMLDDASLLRAMFAAAEEDITVLIDAENGVAAQVLADRLIAAGDTGPAHHASAHPPLVEAESIQRALDLGAIAGCRLHIALVTCGLSLERIDAARRRGQRVTADTCPQYLYLDHELTARPDGGKYICCPPLRKPDDRARLWEAIQRGSLDAVISDHCSYNWQGQKDQGADFTQIPGGLPTIEDRFSLMLQAVNDGHLTLQRVAEVIATQPARLFGLYPRKGAIAVGADADLIVWEPHAKRVISAASHHMLVDYSCFEGLPQVGRINLVLRHGRQDTQSPESGIPRSSYISRT